MEDTFTKSIKLRRDIKYLENTLDAAQEALKKIEGSCDHGWSPTRPDDIHHKGYHDPGDPPGTMGVDRRLSMDVPAKTIKRWKRVCLKCGKTEYTQRTDKQTVETPKW